MTLRRALFLAPAAFALAIAAAGSFAQTASFAQSADPDPRAPAVRTPAQKAFVLEQMRLFVGSIQQISEGLAANDKAKVAAAARPRGMIAVRALPNKPAGLGAAETPEWKALGMATREGFDAIADAAEQKASTEDILARVAATMQNCVACHQTFHLVEGDPSAH